MSTTIESSKTLSEPLTEGSIPKVRGHSKEFWWQLRASGIVLASVILISYLWDLFGLPEFGLEGNRHQWIFPVVLVGILFSVQNFFNAFRDESPRRRKLRLNAKLVAFEREVFPFLEAELKKVDREGDYYGALTMPPLDWTAERMLGDKKEGAAWGARYRDGQGTSHFKFTLENGGREVHFRAEIPGEIETKNGV